MNSRIFIAISLLAASAASIAEAQTVDEILTVWRERQESVKSARFELVQEYNVPAGGLPARLDPSGKARPEEGFPANPLQRTRLYNMAFKGEMLKTDVVHPDFTSEDPNATFPTHTAFDGNEARMIHKASIVDYLEGTIFVEKWNPYAIDTVIKPILLAFRPLSPGMYRQSPLRFRIRQRSVELDGVECVLVEYPPEEGSELRDEYWLDPAHGYRAIRYQSYAGLTQPSTRLDIEYADDPDVGWVPIRWSETRTGMISGTSLTNVAKYEINPEIPDEEFTLEFPIGTHVTDNRLYPKDDRFVIQEDGYWRPVTRAERQGHATHAQLMKTRPGEALEYSALRNILSKLSIGVALLIAGIVAWRIYREKPSQQ